MSFDILLELLLPAYSGARENKEINSIFIIFINNNSYFNTFINIESIKSGVNKL